MTNHLRFELERLAGAGMLLKSTPTPLGPLSVHSVCATKLLSTAADHQGVWGGGKGTGTFGGTQQQTHFNVSAALSKKELDKQDKEGVFLQKEAMGWEMDQGKGGYQLSFLMCGGYLGFSRDWPGIGPWQPV